MWRDGKKRTKKLSITDGQHKQVIRPPVPTYLVPAQKREEEEDSGPSLLATVVAAEIAAELLSDNSSAPDSTSMDSPALPDTDFGGFGGGDSGGGGASGSF